jgi:LysM repeat protein
MYKDLAVSEMNRSGIPASITLAQGMLESAGGNSRLATVANNHFGIKCHGWDGEEIYHDDNAKGECFRLYKNAKESYIDHTDFLLTRSRYAFLFGYKPTDYKSWAKGLRKAGYATDPKYPQRLIDLIERYALYRYDADITASEKTASESAAALAPSKGRKSGQASAWDEFASFNIDRYPVRKNNGTEYVTAKDGDTYASLSNELDMTTRQLRRYNDDTTSGELRGGQTVYIQSKRRKTANDNETHVVREGETMRSISQKYAVRLSRLYALNRMKDGTQPKAGEILNLRKKRKK